MYKIFIDDKRICISNRHAYEAFCHEFHEVNAAGGLVTVRMPEPAGVTGGGRNGKDSARYLFIRRNGLWDLPKGHQEAGEDIRTTALREVSEETGIPLARLQIVKNACARAITLGEKFFEPRKTDDKVSANEGIRFAEPRRRKAKLTALENTFHPRSLNATPPAGVDDPGLICITDHCYKRDGIWHLKHTWWYAMELSAAAGDPTGASPDSPTLTPQTEEGISTAIWVAPQDIPALLAHAYSSIPEVFRHISPLHL